MAGRIELPVSEYDKLLVDLNDARNDAFKKGNAFRDEHESNIHLHEAIFEVRNATLYERIFGWRKMWKELDDIYGLISENGHDKQGNT